MLWCRPRGVNVFVCTRVACVCACMCVCVSAEQYRMSYAPPWGVFLTLFLARNTLSIENKSAHSGCNAAINTRRVGAAVWFHSILTSLRGELTMKWMFAPSSPSELCTMCACVFAKQPKKLCFSITRVSEQSGKRGSKGVTLSFLSYHNS